MNYDEAVAYIESLSPTLVKPGLERFALFMQESASLQDHCPSLHIAGTNGKGSVVSILAETLKQAGLKTGRYIGPHLIAINERFQINGSEISDNELAELCSELRTASEAFALRHPEHGLITWFEIITAIAFFYFARNNTQASVFEVGLGGRFDATNVLSKPVATAIVSIGLDHTHLLGPGLADIAREKAGIMKAGVPLVTACSGVALDAIIDEAAAKSVPVICVDAKTNLRSATGSESEKRIVAQLQKRFAELAIAEAVAGQCGYQRNNAAVAAAVLGIWEESYGKSCLDKFASALSSYFWPGRLQYFPQPDLLLDGAHNEDGARALRQSLDELFPTKKRAFVLCFYKSKHFHEILSALLRPGDRVFASQTTGRRPVVAGSEIVSTARALEAEAEEFPSLEEAFKAALELDSEQFIRIGCGSFAAVAAGIKFIGYDNTVDSQKGSCNLWQPARA
jgi:dihydrofolate synthase/folylpolyglutamate synthase